MEQKSEADLLSAAVALIYDAAVDPAKWGLALQRACGFVGGVKANLFWQDNAAQVVNLHLFNDDPHFTRLYAEVYAPLNPCIPAVFAKDVGDVYAATDLVPVDEFIETRFFKEWVAPQGLSDSVGVVLDRDLRGSAFLSFEVSSSVANVSVKQRAALLAPHFQRAVAIGRFFVKHRANETALIDTLNQVSDAVFLLSGDAQVGFANDSARRMIDDRRLLYTRDDVLHAVAAEADQALSDCVRDLAGHKAGVGARGTTVTLAAESNVRWTANVLPLIDGARRHAIDGNTIVAAMFVRKSIAPPLSPLEALAKDHKLTASEIRVVEAMLRINGLDAIAEALGIARATVKTHLNHVYRKTGARNQSDLIRLVAGLRP